MVGRRRRGAGRAPPPIAAHGRAPPASGHSTRRSSRERRRRGGGSRRRDDEGAEAAGAAAGGGDVQGAGVRAAERWGWRAGAAAEVRSRVDGEQGWAISFVGALGRRDGSESLWMRLVGEFFPVNVSGVAALVSMLVFR